jgi:hypothetical protein
MDHPRYLIFYAGGMALFQCPRALLGGGSFLSIKLETSIPAVAKTITPNEIFKRVRAGKAGKKRVKYTPSREYFSATSLTCI